MTYHFGEAAACDDESCVDQAVQKTSGLIEAFPFFVVHAFFALCKWHRVSIAFAVNGRRPSFERCGGAESRHWHQPVRLPSQIPLDNELSQVCKSLAIQWIL